MAQVNTVYDAAYKGDYEAVVKQLDENPMLITMADNVSVVYKFASSFTT